MYDIHTCYCHRRDPSVSLSPLVSPQLLRDNCPVPGSTGRWYGAGLELGSHWFGQFPLRSSPMVTVSGVLGGELAPRWIFIL